MIVRNEEETLPRCLKSVTNLIDEIIIVDTGSNDKTCQIAEDYKAQVFHYTWENDFAAARNFAFAQATKDYIFWLDADDVLEVDDHQQFQTWKQSSDLTYDSITMDYILSKDNQGLPLYTLKRNRLVRRDRNFQWIGFVHEYLAVSGNILHSTMSITHKKERAYTDRNLKLYLQRKEEGTVFTERDEYYFGNELYDHGRLEEACYQYEKYLDLEQGWIEDRIAACLKLSDCYARLGQILQQKLALLRTLTYDKPRPEFCCRMGNLFVASNQFDQAVYWYRQAIFSDRSESSSMSIHDRSNTTWVPHIQLCLCHDRLGQRESALLHHQMAKIYYPDHPSVLYNEQYFAESAN
ncbi:glycosyltransferase [Paenibacillus shirakamiensis]|nr:glycosyltransferase [Paenibacillus shirakamiensis]